MLKITIDKTCEMCKGDGYLKCTVQQYENFKIWEADPTEEKINAPHDVPAFLKIPCRRSVSQIDRDTMQAMCPTCVGEGKVQADVTLEELKELLK